MASEQTISVILWSGLIIVLQFVEIRLTAVNVFYVSPHANLLHRSIAVVGAIPRIEHLPVATATGSVVEEVQHKAVNENASFIKVDIGLACGLKGSVASKLAYKVFLAYCLG